MVDVTSTVEGGVSDTVEEVVEVEVVDEVDSDNVEEVVTVDVDSTCKGRLRVVDDVEVDCSSMSHTPLLFRSRQQDNPIRI